MYLVVECTTMSAPSAIGCCKAGDRKVLSTTTFAPAVFAAAATWRMSVMRSNGLLGVSIHTIAGPRASAAANATGPWKSHPARPNRDRKIIVYGKRVSRRGEIGGDGNHKIKN